MTIEEAIITFIDNLEELGLAAPESIRLQSYDEERKWKSRMCAGDMLWFITPTPTALERDDLFMLQGVRIKRPAKKYKGTVYLA